MNGMNVNLHIERLVLDGITLSAREQAVLGMVVEAELTRLITAEGLPAGMSSSSVPSLRGGDISLNQPDNPAQLGQQIAQAVYGGNGR